MANTRRKFLQSGAALGAVSAAGVAGAADAAASPGADPAVQGRIKQVTWPVEEGPTTPKICQWFSRFPTEKTVRRWRQAGVTHALVTNPPALPWDVAGVKEDVERLKGHGITLLGMLISPPRNVILGRDGRDAEIEKIKRSLEAAGKAGVPLVEYNWYIHRLSEGYYEVEGRGGAGYTGFDYEREVDGVPVKDLPRPEGVGEYNREQLWENLEYYLRRVIPAAEHAGVRMAVHPNDPPAVISRGNPQILASVEDWKRLVDTVPSPANGMTAHAGVTVELGKDAVEFLRYLGKRDCINHVHYRNVTVEKPRTKYAEVFPDNGEGDMFAYMRELVRQGYNLGILPEHPRALDIDREHDEISGQYAEVGGGGHAGELYDVGYCRAMLQAALITERKVK
ncbi:hypothetical protein GCM10023085_52360 [Actinomadura viridis]|uniref:mannonate dehydratase n=1 Tax=Actinomadura viridis TaxID=58110 RepID=A0A931DLH3_9ACTN|nr:mannonate dehydratase [Actinomadura viridis]MBG6092185.1 mannonate dehydratase [Actinomadura viridis]